jgi:hypothetical protein
VTTSGGKLGVEGYAWYERGAAERAPGRPGRRDRDLSRWLRTLAELAGLAPGQYSKKQGLLGINGGMFLRVARNILSRRRGVVG